jgi:hypothetical protein
MQVISALSKRWGCWSGQLGKVVWCELAAASLGAAAHLPAADQVMAAAGCIDLSWPGSVAV